jgi:hypothetical protein
MRVIIFVALAFLVGCAEGTAVPDDATGGAGGQVAAGGTGGVMAMATGGAPGADGGVDADSPPPRVPCAALAPADVSAVTSVTSSFAKAGENSPTSCQPSTETANIVQGQNLNELSWMAKSFSSNDGGSSHPGMCEIEMTWTWNSPGCGAATATAVFYVSQ